mmetsp:Transcript_72069/g.182269  ORF Transcript_72069/g.182269 Transcript_72069/m.182269 type:complete len:218 (+) Transcript_72069:512-1165(+)
MGNGDSVNGRTTVSTCTGRLGGRALRGSSGTTRLRGRGSRSKAAGLGPPSALRVRRFAGEVGGCGSERSGAPRRFSQRLRRPSSVPRITASSLQKVAARTASAVPTGATRSWSCKANGPLGGAGQATRQTQSSLVAESSQVPQLENAKLETPARAPWSERFCSARSSTALFVSKVLCSAVQVAPFQRHIERSMPPEAKWALYLAPLGETARDDTAPT